MLVVLGLAGLSAARWVYHASHREFPGRWRYWEEIAREVDSVTPPGGAVYANELVYFATHRVPPEGMENGHSHQIQIPAARAADLHVISQAQLEDRLTHGVFDVVLIEPDNPGANFETLSAIYKCHKKLYAYDLFWNRVPSKS